MNMMKKNGGFTLVELIVVIAILAILAGVAVPAYSGYINKANQAADIVKLDAIKTAAMAAEAKNGEVKAVKVDSTGVDVKVGSATTYADVGSDFDVFYTGDYALKTGTTAEWTGGEWSITGTVSGS